MLLSLPASSSRALELPCRRTVSVLDLRPEQYLHCRLNLTRFPTRTNQRRKRLMLHPVRWLEEALRCQTPVRPVLLQKAEVHCLNLTQLKKKSYHSATEAHLAMEVVEMNLLRGPSTSSTTGSMRSNGSSQMSKLMAASIADIVFSGQGSEKARCKKGHG